MSKNWTFGCAFGALVVCLALAPSGFAQVAGGTIGGTVTDPEGKAVHNAEVVILNSATSVKRNLVTNDEGSYSAPNLVPGPYEVTASSTGFKTTLEKVELKLGAETVINLHLEVGDVSEKVVVAAEAPPIDQTGSTLIATVEGRTIRELPLNGRDWTMLATLEPGVHAVDTQQQSTLNTNQRVNRGLGTQLTVSGARPQQNNYRLDGISINDYSGGGPGNTLGMNLGVEAIQEFSVVTSNASGEYGKTSGGVFNAVTRSGTNAFHGTVFDFLRNNALDARDFFDQASTPPFRRNQFGASVGGPVYLPGFGEGGPLVGYNGKSKTFFFADYEGLRQSLSSTNLLTVPSRAARNGQLTTGNVVVNSKVVPYLSIYPLPNVSESGDFGTASLVQGNVTSENFFTARVDHKFSDKDSMRGTFFIDNGGSTGPDNYNFVAIANFSRRRLATLEQSHIFSPNLVNIARLGFSRGLADGPKVTNAIDSRASDIGFGFLPGAPVGTIIITAGGIATFTGAGVGESTYTYNSYQAYDDLFYTRGEHSLKFGGALERIQSNNGTTSTPFGQYQFASWRTFLTNVPQQFTSLLAGQNSRIYLRQTVAGGYVQDDWRVRRNLTLNLGMRYEMATVPKEKYNKLSNLVNLTDAAPTLGAPYFNNPTLRNFSPRVGFAYDPFSDGKTAIRGAFGLYDTLPLTYQFELLTLLTAPFFRQGRILSPTLPPGSFPNGGFQLLTPDRNRGSYVQPDPKRSYVLQWNLNIQRQFMQNLTVQVGYTGSHGVHQPYRTQDTDIVLPTVTEQGLFWPITTPLRTGLRLNENVGQINALAWQASTSYNAMNVKLTQRAQHGLQFGASYTWAKSIDTNSSSVTGGQFGNSLPGLPLFFQNLWKGLSDFDVRHTLIVNYVWELPRLRSGNGLLKTLTTGWQWGGIYRISTGVPFSVLIAGDPLGVRSANPFGFPDRVNTPECKNPVNPGNPDHYIKTECFVAPTGNRLGNSGRNIATGPGISNFDLSLVKNNYVRRFSESFNVQFRAEFFNVLNHSNLRPPTIAASQLFDQNLVSTAANSATGRLTATATTSRQIQFALKVIW